MAIRAMFVRDGAAQGGPYNEDDMRLLLRALAGLNSGVLRDQLSDLVVSILGGVLRVAAGRMVIDGTLIEHDATTDVTPDTPAVGTTGLRVVMRKTWTSSGVSIAAALLQATDGDATPPALTQSDGETWEESLATAEITTGGVIQNLVDTRGYASGIRGTAALATGGSVTTSGTYVDVTNTTATVDTSGGDLIAIAVGVIDVKGGYSGSSDATPTAAFQLDTDAEAGAYQASQGEHLAWNSGGVGVVPQTPFKRIHRFTGVAAGPHTVKMRHRSDNAGANGTVGLSRVQLLVFEV